MNFNRGNMRGVPTPQNNKNNDSSIQTNTPKNVFMSGDKLNATPGTYGTNFGIEASTKSYQAKQNEKDYKKYLPTLIIIGIIILIIFLILVTR